jgi:hypothetical protein
MMTVFLPATDAFAEMIPRSEFAYQNWQGAAYTFEGTSDFSHCVISASYVSGDILYLSVNAGGTVGVGVQSSNLRLSVGETFPVTLMIDGRAPIYATATAATTDFATLNAGFVSIAPLDRHPTTLPARFMHSTQQKNAHLRTCRTMPLCHHRRIQLLWTRQFCFRLQPR